MAPFMKKIEEILNGYTERGKQIELLLINYQDQGTPFSVQYRAGDFTMIEREDIKNMSICKITVEEVNEIIDGINTGELVLTSYGARFKPLNGFQEIEGSVLR